MCVCDSGTKEGQKEAKANRELLLVVLLIPSLEKQDVGRGTTVQEARFLCAKIQWLH